MRAARTPTRPNPESTPRKKLARIRAVILRIPRGRVITYGGAAAAAGFPRAARLTVWALQGGHDLPWHRVVGAGGRIALGGLSAEEQRLRLELEGVRFRKGRVLLEDHEWTPLLAKAHRRTRRDPAPQRSLAGSKHVRANLLRNRG